MNAILAKYPIGKQLTIIWAVLIALTLLSTLVAEQRASSMLMVILICFSFAVKGALVTERLMGLWCSSGVARWLMLGYFVVLPLFIGLAVLFPGVIERITTL